MSGKNIPIPRGATHSAREARAPGGFQFYKIDPEGERYQYWDHLKEKWVQGGQNRRWPNRSGVTPIREERSASEACPRDSDSFRIRVGITPEGKFYAAGFGLGDSEAPHIATIEYPVEELLKADRLPPMARYAYRGPWDGTGLPPIGEEVEVFDENPHESYRPHVGRIVRIVAHDVLDAGDGEGTPVAVYAYEDGDGLHGGYHGLVAGKFRKPKTPEQLAAEKRAATVEKAFDVFYGKPGTSSTRDQLGALFDAGYLSLPEAD